MSILESSFITSAITLYNDTVVPKLSKRNKTISISVVIAMSLIYIITDRILKPPKSLRHIPYIGYYSVIKSIFKRESLCDRSYRVYIPKIDSEKSKGLFLEPGRFGWVVHVSNPEDAKRVLFKHELFPKVSPPLDDKSSLFARFIGGPNILMLNGQHWRAQRKVVNPAFHRSMPIKLFGKLTLEMFKTMESMGDTINVSDLMERWTLEAIGKAGFGFDFNAITDRNSTWVETYNAINEGIRNPAFFLFPILDRKLLWLFPKRKQIHKRLDKFMEMIHDVIQSKRKQLEQGQGNNDLEENEKDLLTLLIGSEIRGENVMSDVELKSNICLFFFAGHDTTSNTLSFAIYYLAKYPEIQKRAREETIEILGDEPNDVLPTVEDTQRMVYINQITKESLRINGSVPRVVPRIATEDTELSGTSIPKGTFLTVNIFNIQHSEKIWKNSDKFDADRFAENGEGRTRAAGEGMAWLPFGNGARQCIGMNFSLNEQRVVLSMLLRKFTWEIPENSKHRNGLVIAGLQVVGLDDLDITFHRRH